MISAFERFRGVVIHLKVSQLLLLRVILHKIVEKNMVGSAAATDKNLFVCSALCKIFSPFSLLITSLLNVDLFPLVLLQRELE